MDQARLEIVEQPQQRGMRFRYECEGRSAGSIPGENTTGDKKTWPSCQILNYSGHAVIRVSLVSKDDPPRPHPHSLVGRDCERGVCQINVGPENQMVGVFPNLGIQCVRRKEVTKAIIDRINNQINPFNTVVDGDERSLVDVDLNIVRLCFEAFIRDHYGHYTIKLNPVVSQPIFDKKATCAGILKICRVDKTHGSAEGNDEVFLLCDKVQKEDIQVVFCRGNWEALAEFSSVDVHRQVAIVFRTPPFRDRNIQESVEVEFKLRRPSDSQVSKSLQFTYLPVQHEGKHKVIPNIAMPVVHNDGRDKVRSAIVKRVADSRAENSKKRPHPDSAGTSSRMMHQHYHSPTNPRPATSFMPRPPSTTSQTFVKTEPINNIWNYPPSQPMSPFPHQQQPSTMSSQTSFMQQTLLRHNQPMPFPTPHEIPQTQSSAAIMPELETMNSFPDMLMSETQDQKFPSIGPELTKILEDTGTTEVNGFSTLEDLMQKNCSIENPNLSISELLPPSLTDNPPPEFVFNMQSHQIGSPQSTVMSPTTPINHTQDGVNMFQTDHSTPHNIQMYPQTPSSANQINQFGSNFHTNNNNNQFLTQQQHNPPSDDVINDFLKQISPG